MPMESDLQIRGKTLMLRGYGCVDLARMVRTYGKEVTREVLQQLAEGSPPDVKHALRDAAAS